MTKFVHLHTHSDYSLLDAAQKVSTIVNHTKELGMDAIALTEHGNMFSAVEFSQEADKAGIKSIIGCEVYVAYGDRKDRTPHKKGEGMAYHHLVLLAQNQQGYKNLMKLVSLGYREGFYYKPRVDKELLRKYNEGLIALSACLKGEVAQAAFKKGYEEAKEAALGLADIFPDRFYLEIQNHGIPEEAIVRDAFLKLSQDIKLPLVCTNDAHYTKQENADSHDVLFCLGNNKEYYDENRPKYHGDSFYLKTPDEMAELFKDYPGAVENTVKIAEQCNVEIELGKYLQPTFPIPESIGTDDENVYLQILAEEGLKKIFPNGIPENYASRLEFELNVISNMGYPGYFLIVQDFVRWAKDQGIPVGPGRGSAAGSLVAYVLGITNIDPLKYDLLFERFLNPERVSMPDIDIDFCYVRRGEVIDYIKDLYGEDSVCQIITFGQMKAKAVVRDVARVLGMSFADGAVIAKLIPDELKMTLSKAEEQVKEIKELVKSDKRYEELWRHAKVLEGMKRHAGIHAAGVVIAPGNVMDYVPLYQSTKGDVTTQYDMNILDQVGILKMDFLGLRTLTVIQDALDMIKSRGIEIDIDSISLEDEATYSLFSEGATHGVFQFESAGMREYLKQLKPNRIDDLVAMNALYRPGPMGNIPSFIARKHGTEKIEYLHPLLEPILKDTYGIIVYQEQVIQIANKIGGFPLGKADNLRRAMGKKKMDIMKQMQPEFIRGAGEHNVSKKVAEDIYDLIYKFASYGFNKSHSVAYAYVAYQTAYLKAHYPSEFMAAYLTSERTNLSRVVELVNECHRMDIPVKHPDVNSSSSLFTSDGKSIIFGLSALKNMGEKAAETIEEARKEGGAFTSIFDFASRVDLKSINRKAFEALIYAGAMDSLEGNRNQKLRVIDTAIHYGQKLLQDKNNSQVDLFGNATGNSVIVEPELEDVPDWNPAEKLDHEKEFIGFYLSGHPIEEFRDEINSFSNIDLLKEKAINKNTVLKVGGIVAKKSIAYDKRNNPWARFTLSTLTGEYNFLIFSKTYAKFKELIENDANIFLEGKVSERDMDSDSPAIIVDSVIPLENVRKKYVKNLHIRVGKDSMTLDKIHELKTIAEKYPGEVYLIVHIYRDKGPEQRVLAKNVRVNASVPLIEKFREKVGKQNVWFD